MSRYLKMEAPRLFPMQSLVTGHGTKRQGPFVDTGVNIPGYGEVYLTKNEILEMARLVEPSLFEKKEAEEVHLTIDGSELIDLFKEGLLNVIRDSAPSNLTLVFAEPSSGIIPVENIPEEPGVPKQGDPAPSGEGLDDVLRFESKL